jgi:topoisomerase-4 subunit A
VYAKDVVAQLYAFTECEVSLQSQMVVISDGGPKEVTVSEALHVYVERLKWCLQKELEYELSDIKQQIFARNLERIFIEEKLYQLLETVEVFEQVYGVLGEAFVPFHQQLVKKPEKDDFESLLKIPIRRIAKFDLTKNQEECRLLEEREANVLRSLSDITKFSIRYLESLLKKYGADFPRRTQIQDLEIVDKRSMEKKEIEIGFDPKEGYIGLKVSGPERVTCTNFDKILVMLSDGTYKVVNITDRMYVGKPGVSILHCGVADKQQIFTCCYRDKMSGISFCKRFVVKQFIMEREYRYVDEGCEPLLLSIDPKNFFVQLLPKSRQRVSSIEVKPAEVPVKGVSAHGIRLSTRPAISIEVFK